MQGKGQNGTGHCVTAGLGFGRGLEGLMEELVWFVIITNALVDRWSEGIHTVAVEANGNVI